MSAVETEWADWCVDVGGIALSGTRMREHTREPHGVTRWCFVCHKHCDFELVITVPDGPSYYGPNARIECVACKTNDGDLFPGRYRTWEEG